MSREAAAARWAPTVWDWLVPVLLAVLGTAELAATSPDGLGAGVLLTVLACAALVPRRRFPLVAPTAGGVLITSMPWVSAGLDEVATPILVGVLASYSLARWIRDHRGLAGLAVILVVILGDYLWTDPRDNDVTDAVFVLSLMVPPYVFGRITRRLAEQSEQLARQQDVIREQAVREERGRIAREVHDVIAHSVSAMVVQTAAARDLVRSDPDRAEEVLDTVAETGRSALGETGRLLHVLRDADDELGLAPTPGLGDLDALLERFRGAGLAVDVEVDGPLDGLPAALDTSSYRVVQEALTNALRYADGAVLLRVQRGPDGVAIRASNTSNGVGGQGSGLGLAGLAERVSLLGGRLSHGVSPSGRFELVAEIPT